MSGRDPQALLAKAAGTSNRKSGKQTRHMKEAGILADLFAQLSVRLTAGEVEPARKMSHQAHALLEVLAALDAQDEHPELSSPKCDERLQAAKAWKRLMRPDAWTTDELRDHFETRRFSYIRLAPLPALPTSKPREAYKGGIYETVFLPDDPKRAKKLGLPEAYAFRHGVTTAGFKLSLHSAIERKMRPSKRGDVIVQSIMRTGPDLDWVFNTLLVYKEHFSWYDKQHSLPYSIHSTTYAEAAEELAAARGGKKQQGPGSRR